MRVSERLEFIRQFRREFVHTGAVQPSSRFLAREMAARLRDHGDGAPRRIVEMGPGTGSVTRAIARAMGSRDRLDCYEINEAFADYLRRRVETDADFRPVRDRVHVHCMPAQEANPGAAIDAVICSVPLNNLPPPIVDAIFARGFDLLRPGGWFTYFEYPWLPAVKRRLADAAERARIDGVKAVKSRYRGTSSRSRLVPANIPPARAVHIRN